MPSLVPRTLQTMPPGILKLYQILLLSSTLFSVIVFSMVLYLTNYAAMSAAQASDIESTFMACHFGLHFLGGIMIGRFISHRNLCALSLGCQIVGALIMIGTALEQQLWGLTIILMGTGFTFITINCMLTELLQTIPKQRNTVFLWAYGIMNLGFVIGLTLSGLTTLFFFRTTLMLMCAGANITALYILIKHRTLITKHTATVWSPKKQHALMLALILLGLPVLHLALHAADITHVITLILGLMAFIVLAALTLPKAKPEEIQNLKLFFVLVASATLFWTMYQLTPNLLMLFIEHHVDRIVLGFKVPPQWFANVNPMLILLGAPWVAHVLKRCKQANMTPSLPTKFAAGLVLMSIGSMIFLIGLLLTDVQHLMAPIWVVAKITFESFAELLIAPIGLAMIGVLIPQRWQSMFMGTWMMINGLASAIAGFIAHHTLHPMHTPDAVLTPLIHNYFLLTSVGVMCAILLCSIASALRTTPL